MFWGRYHHTLFQVIPQSHSDENSMALGWKQIFGLVYIIENIDIMPYKYSHLIFGKDAKIHIRKKTLS